MARYDDDTRFRVRSVQAYSDCQSLTTRAAFVLGILTICVSTAGPNGATELVDDNRNDRLSLG